LKTNQPVWLKKVGKNGEKWKEMHNFAPKNPKNE
jgi:hypothetical protein